MTLIVKIMSGEDLPDTAPEKRFTLHAGVKSFHPVVQPPEAPGGQPYCYVRLYIADPVKTAAVPGFVEHEVTVEAPGNVYVMNEAGKTIATWTPPCGRPN
ncbi:hypothetical protein CcrKarma_gp134 [Caulobacter virus Karma]|uniref:Uncharacterized protein n=1 Tax=Caulobacter phage BL57 TaxID=3348355 RepID=A0AB74UIQ8_9VIRU|nr:hypothetical protein CcrKarma_gp134 [Caulobacter virus Karma]AFU87651.1 hypothetical protein CcrKarma_gp134 [Caulobacter virus Karma]ARB14347.1 hypothetical protein Ccr5_gp128 [Caulobacter phage Ccr5]